jgi:hypothetical protein
MAMTMPITTNTTIATCIQIHVGDTRGSLAAVAARGAHPRVPSSPASKVQA